MVSFSGVTLIIPDTVNLKGKKNVAVTVTVFMSSNLTQCFLPRQFTAVMADNSVSIICLSIQAI